MRKAFTMIEIIFVIVVIGILAAVAIPKLAATRDDAKISATAHAVTTAAFEVAAYAVANGKIEQDFTIMSNSISMMIKKKIATQSGDTLNIAMHNVTNCLKMIIPFSNMDANLTVGYGAAGSDDICKGLQETIHSADYPIPLRGARIAR